MQSSTTEHSESSDQTIEGQEMTQSDFEAAKNHPYLQLLGRLNITACYKKMILAGNPQIEPYINEMAQIRPLRADFESKYPQLAAQFKKTDPGDCIII